MAMTRGRTVSSSKMNLKSTIKTVHMISPPVFWSPMMSVRNRLKFKMTCLIWPCQVWCDVCKHKWDLRSAVQWKIVKASYDFRRHCNYFYAKLESWSCGFGLQTSWIWIWVSEGLVLVWVYDFPGAFLNRKEQLGHSSKKKKVTRVKPTWSLEKMAVLDSHRAVCGVGAAEVRTRPGAEVGVVPFGLMDPPPAQILPEVDVQRPNAAVLLVVSESRRKAVTFSTCPFTSSLSFAPGVDSAFIRRRFHTLFSLGCF